jgi:ceramide glucosyltransferase
MTLNLFLTTLALLSLALTLWQWFVARRFPLHHRIKDHPFPPAVTLLKPLKGCDKLTEACLRSWFEQDYTGRVQILFGVASSEDPVGAVVRALIQAHPGIDAELIICGEPRGANAKVSKLAKLESLAKHGILVISDADVLAPPDLLSNVVCPLRESERGRSCSQEASNVKGAGTASPESMFPERRFGDEAVLAPFCGLVTCFYRLANPTTLAMRWEAIAINADFWSQVLQAQSFKPIDFALGAVMATRREQLQQIGGFASLENFLADDYQLGNRIARHGHRIVISPVVVECWSPPMNWRAVWKHQLRWARTIRVCQPLPYFFSILSNATLWPLLWLSLHPLSAGTVVLTSGCLLLRIATGLNLQKRLSSNPIHQSSSFIHSFWLIPLKDLLQTFIWLLAFFGNRIEWRGQRLRLCRDGTLVEA